MVDPSQKKKMVDQSREKLEAGANAVIITSSSQQPLLGIFFSVSKCVRLPRILKQFRLSDSYG
jgi:hypothetical protein